MATLDNLPTIDPPLANRPMPGDRGPDWIDAETVAALQEQIHTGIVSFGSDPSQVVAEADQAELESLFAKHLAASPSSSPFPLVHRTYALTMAINSLVTVADTGVDANGGLVPPTLREVEIAERNLEAYLLGMTGSEQLAEVPEEHRSWLLRESALLTIPQVEALTGFTENQLAQWRRRGIGPKFVKTSAQARSVRYPVAAILDWLHGLVNA